MTEQEILQQIEDARATIDKMNAMLDEVRSGNDDPSQGASLAEDERERQHQEDLQRLRGLRLIDDDFMNACFDGYTEGAELLLRIILDKPDIHVKSVKTQSRMKNLLGRDICLDIDANDDTGKKYNIEVQRADKGASRKRARYHSSILDAHLLKPGEDFNDLPESFVIFITENDVIGKNEPLYRIERKIEETGEAFDDGEHIVYVNGADKDASTALGKLMHDFYCTEPDDMHYKELADKVRYFKEDEEGVAAMSKVMEDMRNEAAKEAAEKAKRMQAVEIVLRMLSRGLSHEQIAEYVGITVEQVCEIAGTKGV